VTGDGLVRPVGAPSSPGVQPGVQPGASSAVVIANRVIVFGPSGSVTGIFVYTPGTVPAPGNPPVVSIGAGTSDPYGNTVRTGIVDYAFGGLTWTQLDGGVISFSGGSGIEGASGGELVLGTVGTTCVQIAFPLTNPLVASEPGSITTPEPWHAMTLINGWANSGASNTAKYRLVAAPANSVQVAGAINGAAATSATFATLPASYQPLSNQSFQAGCTSLATAQSWGQLDTAGNCTLEATAFTNRYVFGGVIPLDAA
jgi:hypothetical protein